MGGHRISDKILEHFSEGIEVPKITILIPLTLFELISVVVSTVARSEEVLMVRGNVLPVATFAGVFSALANIFIILMVVMYKRLGLIVSLIAISLQMPRLILGIIAMRNLSTIPGLFLNITLILTITIIYISQRRLQKEKDRLRSLFEQTAFSLVNAIDAKDSYTHGHSSRVAEYSRRLAKLSGKNEKECYEVYYTALLHDVGKIGIPISIINKNGKLTPEEYELIKQHPTLGAQILETIDEFPFLRLGAHYHHERYDGKGYPEGLKGDEIPEIARIISVADAYDAMTSIRSYRDPIPQHKVREEIIVCSGTQFDPVYAKLMLRLLDDDTKYEMKEKEEVREDISRDDELVIGEYRSIVKEGILLTPNMTTIYMTISSDDEASGLAPSVSMILFDALDGEVHSTEKEIREMLYFEYGEIWLDGNTTTGEARKIECRTLENEDVGIKRNGEYIIEAVRIKDHALIRILGKNQGKEVIVALPDSTRYMYIGLTGNNCHIGDLKVNHAAKACPDNYIPRIADEISFIDGPVGDIPNLQVDGDRTAYTEGIPVGEKLEISFHTKSLPTARLVWHCPYIVLFSSDNGHFDGPNCRKYSMLKINGENDGPNEHANTAINLKKKDAFKGWDAWKEYNKQGFDSHVTIEKVHNGEYKVRTENMGLDIETTTSIKENVDKVYATLTGDEVALTNIHVR